MKEAAIQAGERSGAERKPALLLVNTKSRQGADALEVVQERLKAAGLKTIEPEGTEDLGEVIKAHAGTVERVILGGGDGTMNSAADALLETGLPFGVLPLGTANDLARTLGIPMEIDKAAEIAAGARSRRIDVGLVNGKAFFNVASIGLSVEVSRELTGEVKKRYGKLGYPITVWRVLHKHEPFKVEIRCDGKVSKLKALQVAVGNGRHYGGGMTVHEDAAIDDGSLDIYALKAQPTWRLVARAWHIRSGRHDDPESVIVHDGENAEVVTEHPMPVNTDGEVTTQTPARFEVRPKALEVFVGAERPA